MDFTDPDNIQLVDLTKKDKTKKLRRSRYEGVLVEVSMASNRTCIHASINAIQVIVIVDGAGMEWVWQGWSGCGRGRVGWC